MEISPQTRNQTLVNNIGFSLRTCINKGEDDSIMTPELASICLGFGRYNLNWLLEEGKAIHGIMKLIDRRPCTPIEGVVDDTQAYFAQFAKSNYSDDSKRLGISLD
ncbi:hypothetical protein Trydic_g47 [Trypoxylus dichotomus]